MSLGIGQFATNIAVALALGATIGVERQWRQRLAGLQTNALVALGAAGFVGFSQLMPGDSSPTRVAAQVVSGIGFLGAGVIFKDGLSVRGLNTAATIWCSAAVGVLSGIAMTTHAAALAGFVVAVNLVLRPLAARMLVRAEDVSVEYAVVVVCRRIDEARIRTLLLKQVRMAGLQLQSLDSVHVEGGDRGEITATLTATGKAAEGLESAVGALSLDPGVTAARWRQADPRE
jgi:putative Mg2+ transporter-C (MgtC) family protein